MEAILEVGRELGVASAQELEAGLARRFNYRGPRGTVGGRISLLVQEGRLLRLPGWLYLVSDVGLGAVQASLRQHGHRMGSVAKKMGARLRKYGPRSLWLVAGYYREVGAWGEMKTALAALLELPGVPPEWRRQAERLSAEVPPTPGAGDLEIPQGRRGNAGVGNFPDVPFRGPKRGQRRPQRRPVA